MNRKNCADKKELARMDAVNDERLETTKKRVAHAIGLLKLWTQHAIDNNTDEQKILNDLAHAVNLLESAEEEMMWHCEWYDYDQEICYTINDACADIGIALADIVNDIDEYADILGVSIKDGLTKLSKALATLIRWNDETVDISEV